MDRLKKRVTLTVLVIGGVVCLSLSIAFPLLVPVLVPTGCVLLAGAFGMFQSSIGSNANNDADDNRQPNTQNQESSELPYAQQNNAPTNTVNILFMYNQNMNNQERTDISKPHVLIDGHDLTLV